MKSVKSFKVEYTKHVGGVGSIIVRADTPEQALGNAKGLCATGSDFRNATETSEKYVKPRKQGFAGFN